MHFRLTWTDFFRLEVGSSFFVMNRLINIFFLVFCFTNTFSQIQIINNTTQKPISNVYLIADDGGLLYMTSVNGIVDVDKIKKDISDSIDIFHVSYQKKKIALIDFSKKENIYLTPNKIQLEEIILSPKKKSGYIILKGYFRSYQLNNRTPLSYMDGFVEYFIPIKKNKRLCFHILENRTYRNMELYNQENAWVYGDGSGVPYIERKTLFKQMRQYKTDSTSRHYYTFLSKNNIIGNAYIDSLRNIVNIHVDFTLPERSYERSFLGKLVIKFTNESVTESYLSSNITTLEKKNLIFHRRYIKRFPKLRKQKTFSNMIETYHEFYVLEKAYISNKKYKQTKCSYYTGPRGTNYKILFEKEMTKYNIPPIPKYIKNTFHKTLKPYYE